MVTCGKIRLTPVNGRTVRLSGDLTKCKTKKDKDNKLVSLNCEYDDCEMTIKVGQTVRPKPKYPHRVNVIFSGRTGIDVVCYDLMIAEVNTTSVFALPFMGGNRKPFMWDSQFINAFMGTPEDENCICLLSLFW